MTEGAVAEGAVTKGAVTEGAVTDDAVAEGAMTASGGVLVVDAANVVGSRPDGWWRDRAGAAERLVGQLAAGAAQGLPPELTGRRVVVVLEGRAVTAQVDGHPGVDVVRAPHDGDATIVEVVTACRPDDVLVVTSDRELRRRVEELGATVRGAGWLREVLDGVVS